MSYKHLKNKIIQFNLSFIEQNLENNISVN